MYLDEYVCLYSSPGERKLASQRNMQLKYRGNAGRAFPFFFMVEHCGGRPAHCLIFMGLLSWHSQLIFVKWTWPCSWLLSVNLGFFTQEMQSAKDDVTEMKRNFGIYGRKIIWDSKSVFPSHGNGTTESFFFLIKF